MRGYGQYCPVARAAEVFAERWTPIIMRNVLIGCRTFSEIRRGAPGISKTLLSQRLAALERAGILRRERNGAGRGWRYEPTAAGEELWDVCVALGNWGARWLELAPEHFDPYFVLWAMCRTLERDRLPQRRVVVRFDFPDVARHKRFWLLLENGTGEVCIKYSGLDEDLVVEADSRAFACWHMGRLSWVDAVRQGDIRLNGPRDLVRAFPTWNSLSHFADVQPAHRPSGGQA